MQITTDIITKIYLFVLGRAPDAEGLKYWTEKSSLRTAEEVIASFFDQPEVQEKYPDAENTYELLTIIYQNLFERLPDEEGLGYWTKFIEEVQPSKSLLVLSILNGAKGEDAKLIANREKVALAFAKLRARQTRLRPTGHRQSRRRRFERPKSA